MADGDRYGIGTELRFGETRMDEREPQTEERSLTRELEVLATTDSIPQGQLRWRVKIAAERSALRDAEIARLTAERDALRAQIAALHQ